uniref:Uncharacterized protein n=1 Tax=Fagus sylvatica TaxID=28930 RepID=A0A2N9GLW3_FAGSY
MSFEKIVNYKSSLVMLVNDWSVKRERVRGSEEAREVTI